MVELLQANLQKLDEIKSSIDTHGNILYIF